MIRSNKKLRILYVQYAAPGVYPPIERSAKLFKQLGWQVGFLGVYADGESSKLRSSLHSEEEIEYLTHTLGGLKALRCYVRFWWRALRRVQQERPDVVYVSDILAYPAGLLVSLMTPAITVLHEHDTPLDHASALMRFLQPMRARFARRADILVNPQPERAQWLQDLAGGRDVFVVFNCPDVEELNNTLRFDEKPKGLILWHHGSLGPGRLPLTILDAMNQLPSDVRLEIAGYETPATKGFIDSVTSRARELGISDRVIYHGAIPRRDKLYEVASRAHIGLAVFVQNFIEPMAGASNKPFDFLGANMALLVNNTDEWKNFAVSRGVAVSVNPDDPDDIARVLKQLYEYRGQLQAMVERGGTLLKNEWNYPAQFSPVLAKIDQLLRDKQKVKS